jgi:hypothetical protein
MSSEWGQPTKIVVKAIEPGHRYQLSMHKPTGAQFTQEVRLPSQGRFGIDPLESLDPFAFGFEQASIQDFVGEAGWVDLFLPPDPIAALDWEKISCRPIVRRVARATNYRRLPISMPLGVCVASMAADPATVGYFVGKEADLFPKNNFESKLDCGRCVNVHECHG